MTVRRTLVAAALLAAAASATGVTPRTLALLGHDLSGWRERSFDGRTRYAVVRDAGRPVLRAEARGTASGLYREREVSLERWPVLAWSWRAGALPGVDDERSRAGDDFALRVYVIARDPLLFWRTRAVCYVWSARAQRGDSWPNPFTGNVRVLALRGARDPAGEWRGERRDVAADFRMLFGEAPRQVDAVAVMTDADQGAGVARGEYRGLRFEAAGGR